MGRRRQTEGAHRRRRAAGARAAAQPARRDRRRRGDRRGGERPRGAGQDTHDLAPDVVLLDVRMPGMDGLEAARHLNVLEEPPAVIFTTAYDQYAVEAFEAHAVGYLLKPVRKEQLAASLVRAGRLTRAQLQRLAAAARGAAHPHRCAPPRGLRLIPIEEVQYFLADQKYTTVRHVERRGSDRGFAAAARERVRRGVRAHPPQRAGGREVPRAHRAQRRRPVLRAAARLRGAAAGEPAHGGGAEGAIQDLSDCRR